MVKLKNLEKLIEIIATLRSPQGCEWDRQQTHKTLRQNFLEEVYEAVDAIDEEDKENLKEELGDVLLQIVLHAQIASEVRDFTLEDVAEVISEKLIRRHPHVFGNQKVSGTEEILANWEEIKKAEKPERTSVLSGISKSQPALLTAYKISKKAVKTGFEWPNKKSLMECIQSEFVEFEKAVELEDEKQMEDELGDILFSVVNLARWHKINPELALINANNKFKKRFQTMEKLANKELNKYSFEEYDELWKKAKKELEESK